MKRFYLNAIFGLFFLNSHAQDQKSTPYGTLQMQNQIGFNATGFIKTFLTFSNTGIPTNTYVPVCSFTYKALFSNVILPSDFKFGFRLGINYSNNEVNSGTDTTYNNTKTKTMVWRAGIEIQQTISKRFVLFYGADYYNNNTVSENNNKSVYNVNPPANPTRFLIVNNINTNKFYGMGPFIGIQFNINQYLSLSSEAGMYFIKGTNSNLYTYTMSDGSNYTNYRSPSTSGTMKITSIALPGFINLNFMF